MDALEHSEVALHQVLCEFVCRGSHRRGHTPASKQPGDLAPGVFPESTGGSWPRVPSTAVGAAE
eukprot:171381-Chlamydomonas_euryale.AAC.1